MLQRLTNLAEIQGSNPSIRSRSEAVRVQHTRRCGAPLKTGKARAVVVVATAGNPLNCCGEEWFDGS